MLINGSYIPQKNNQKVISMEMLLNSIIVKESFLRKDNTKVNSRVKFQ